MFQSEHGTVLRVSDVETGQWHPEYHLFDASSLTPNAVRVRVRRSKENENSVPVTMLRIVGLSSWDVTVHAIAQRFIPDCLIDGLVAEGQVVMSSTNVFNPGMCIHGQQGVRVRQNNEFYPGVNVTMPPGINVTAPGDDISGNPGLDNALGHNILHPWMVNHVSAIIEDLLDRDTDVLPEYIDAEQPVLVRSSNWKFDDVEEGRIYHIQCAGENNLSAIPSNAVLTRIAVISDCNFNVRAGARLSDMLIAARGGGDLDQEVVAADTGPGNSGNSGAGNSGGGNSGGGNSGGGNSGGGNSGGGNSGGGNSGGGNSGGGNSGGGNSGGGGATIKANMVFSSNVELGADDACAPGGGVQVFSTNNIHYSAGIVINGMQVVAAGEHRPRCQQHHRGWDQCPGGRRHQAPEHEQFHRLWRRRHAGPVHGRLSSPGLLVAQPPKRVRNARNPSS